MAIDLEQFPESESAKRMISYVSKDFYDKSYVGKWIYEVMGQEWDAVWEIIESLPYQVFPETATWGLKYHEQKWHLPIRKNLDNDTRRKLICQKRDGRSPMNPAKLGWHLENATGFKVRVEDTHDTHLYGWKPMHPNTFIVYFEGDGTLDVAIAKERLKELRQSHTTYLLKERVNDELNNAAIWHYDNFRLILGYAVSFWGVQLLDGLCFLDGSLELNGGKRRYNLVPGIKYLMGDIESTEKIDHVCLRLRDNIEEKESLGENAGAAVAFAVYFWVCMDLDNALTVNPTVSVHTQAQTKERIAVASVRTVKNLAYLNGSLKMNGSRVLNSIDRREEL